MKFAYTGGPYKEYRGYVFTYGNPTDVADKATIEALSVNPLYRRIENAVQREERQEAAEEVTTKRPQLRGLFFCITRV